MNTDQIILRETDNLPLINKDDVLTNADLDGNFIKIYNDLLSLCSAEDSTLIYDDVKSYIIGEYATYDGKLWLCTEDCTGVTPGSDITEWTDAFPTILAHQKNKDTILDEGGTNETTVAEIRAFIDAGLTSTTNLTLTTKTATSFKIESSTGTDVILPQATVRDAGLLSADDKVKLQNTEGTNTGDQTLESLNAEDVDNKVTDFTTINDTLYPTTQAVDTYLTAQVPDLVETFLDSNVELNTNKATDFTTVNDTLYPSVKAVDDQLDLKVTSNTAITGATKTKITYDSKGLVTSGADATTSDIADSLNKRYVTDANLTVIGNTSGTNTGDQTLITLNAEDVDNKATTFAVINDTLYPSVKAVDDQLDLKVDKVVGSRLITSAEGTKLDNTSGTNTGDQIISDATISLTDITTNNVSSTKHGFAPKTPNNTTTFLRGDGTWATPSAGGLTYFSEAQNTTSPNATVPVDSLTAVTGTTNGDFAIIPKGTGAFIVGHIPDGSTGGVKRGAGAIELQSGAMYYDGATGANSVVIGKGSGATATGAIAIGTNCNASGNYSLALGGVATGLYSVSIGGVISSGQSSVAMSGATASGTNSFAFGTATASGFGSFAIGGEAGGTANASSPYCTAIGSSTTASGRYSMAILSNSNTFTHGSRFSYGSYNSSANNPVGSIQGSTLVTGADTTTATPTTLGNYGGTVIPLILQNNNSIRFKGTIIGRQSGSTNTSAWDIDGIIQRGVGVATTTLLISNVNVVQNTPAWGTPTLTADTTNGGLDIKVIGAATTNIRWTCVLNTTEVILA